MNFILKISFLVLLSNTIYANDYFDNWYYSKNNLNLGNTFNIAKGSKNVTVAIIDTGIDANHENFHNVNIVKSFDFVKNSEIKVDNHGHGTHVAGIIAGKNTGIANGISIMPLKYTINSESDKLYANKMMKKLNINDEDEYVVSLSIKALNYAIDNKVDIINYSGGGYSYSQEEFNALKRAEDKGILVIVAAGNGNYDLQNKKFVNMNIEDNRYYPCSYKLSNIICVGNSNQLNFKEESSNYGKDIVDIFASGKQITSSLPNNKYGELTGTSQATPFVTALAALIKSEHPEMNYKEIKKEILGNASEKISLKRLCKTSGLLNIEKTLKSIEQKNKTRYVASKIK